MRYRSQHRRLLLRTRAERRQLLLPESNHRAAGSIPGRPHALGVALEELKREAEAKTAYQQAIAYSRGQHAPAHFHLGLLTANAGDYEAAVVLFKKAISISHDSLPSCHNNLGVMLALTGRLKQAKLEFETALRQTHGALTEAADNLNLCRALLSSDAMGQLAKLKLSEMASHRVSAGS